MRERAPPRPLLPPNLWRAPPACSLQERKARVGNTVTRHLPAIGAGSARLVGFSPGASRLGRGATLDFYDAPVRSSSIPIRQEKGAIKVSGVSN